MGRRGASLWSPWAFCIALWARKPIGADLVSPALAGGIGIAMAGIGAAAVGDDWDLAWRSILALVVAGVLALATRPAKLRPLTITARVVVAAFFAWSYVVAAIDLFDHPSLERAGPGRARSADGPDGGGRGRDRVDRRARYASGPLRSPSSPCAP